MNGMIQAKMSLMAQQAQNQLPLHLMGKTPAVVTDAGGGGALCLDLDTIQSQEVGKEPQLLRKQSTDLFPGFYGDFERQIQRPRIEENNVRRVVSSGPPYHPKLRRN
jgi:hypothetical protein